MENNKVIGIIAFSIILICTVYLSMKPSFPGYVLTVGLHDLSEYGKGSIISEYDDFVKYFSKYANYKYNSPTHDPKEEKYDPILDKYDVEYFKNKSIAKVCICASSSTSIKYKGLKVKDNAATIIYKTSSTEWQNADELWRCIIAEIPKNINKILVDS